MNETPEGHAVKAAYLGIAVEHYTSDRLPELTGAKDQIETLGIHLSGFGYVTTVLPDPTVDAMRHQIADWRDRCTRGGPAEAALIAWSGHAENHGGTLRLALHDTVDTGDEDQTRTPTSLAQVALNAADQVLILIDTCHSGAALTPSAQVALRRWAAQTLPPGRAAWLGILASAQASQPADGRGLLIELANRLLTDGPAGEYRAAWSVRTKGISGHALVQTLLDEWPADAGQRPADISSGLAREVFRNPCWRPGAGAELVEHLVLASRGIAPTEEGWFFTGRREVLAALVGWLGTGKAGVHVVTGPAGCGKSAVVGRLAALSDPDQRARLTRHAPLAADDPDPGERSIDAAFFLRGATLDSATREIAHRLGLAAPANPNDLVAEVTRLEHPPALVLDGLDEAAPGAAHAIRRDLIEPLGRVARILLATRDRAFRSDDSAEGLVGDDPVLDLATTPGTKSDIGGYLRQRLAADKVPQEAIDHLAPVVAERAARGAGGFLFARIVAGQIGRGLVDVADPRVQEELAGGIGAALDLDLDHGPVLHLSGAPAPGAARELLRALAWAQGRGMPVEMWTALAAALSPVQTAYDLNAIDQLLRHYGRYLMEDADDGHAVYRLYHREFLLHLRGDTRGGHEDVAARTVIDTLVSLVEQQTTAPATRSTHIPISSGISPPTQWRRVPAVSPHCDGSPRPTPRPTSPTWPTR